MIASPKKPIKYAFNLLPKFLRQQLRSFRWCSRWLKWKMFPDKGYPNPSILVNEKELRPHIKNAFKYLRDKYEPDTIGDILEFGVCHGTSIILMYKTLAETDLNHIRLFGFDSFEGLPDDTEGEWEEGLYSADYQRVKDHIKSSGVDCSRVILIKGFYENSLNDEVLKQYNLKKASLIMIDCDLYSSSKEALNFCVPLILDETIIIFDDWNPHAQENKGEKRAFDEFLAENPFLKADCIGEYNYNPGDRCGKIFRVTNKNQIT